MRFSAPAGWHMAYRVGAGALNIATDFPLDLNPGNASTFVWAQGSAPGHTDSGIFYERWNSIFL